MLRQRAFTLIELLLVIGIIAVLAGIVITAVNPQAQFVTAQNAKRQAAVREIQNAISQYQIATGTLPDPSKTLPSGAVNAMSICRSTVQTYCYDLSALIPTYLASLPIDPAEPSTVTTGFGLQQTSGNQVQAAALHVGVSSTGDPTDYMARWALQDNAASTTLVGTAGGNAILLGGDNTATLSTAGPGGTLTKAMQLDGAADYISFSDVVLASSTPYTFAAYAKLGTAAGVILTVLGNNSSDSASIRFSSMYLNGGRNDGTSINATFATPISTWHHIAVTRDLSGVIHLWEDGVEVTGSALTSTNGWTINQIGRTRNGVFDRYFNGAMADVRIYNRALSAAEVAALAALN